MIIGESLIHEPQVQSHDNCLAWKRKREQKNEEKFTLNTSQAEPVAANSTAVRQFISILSLTHAMQFSMGLHFRMNESFFSIHGVQDP